MRRTRWAVMLCLLLIPKICAAQPAFAEPTTVEPTDSDKAAIVKETLELGNLIAALPDRKSVV